MLNHLNLFNVLVLDIETVPQYPSYDLLPDNFKKLWDLKTTYLRKTDQSAEDFYEKAGIWAEFGKVICISIGMFSTMNSFRVKSFFGHDEKEILQGLAKLFNSLPNELVLCAHNGKEFDYPYLCRRYLINNLEIPSQLDISNRKPWEINHLDTLDLWKFGDYKNYTSLNLLAAIFDIPTPKDDIDGSMVAKVYWEENDLQRIKNYCQKDVITTARLLQKFKGLPFLQEENITYAD